MLRIRGEASIQQNAKLGKHTASPFRRKMEDGIGGEMIPDVEEAEIRDKLWSLG